MTGGAILVAGAGGAVGFAIVRALRGRGCDVIATYRTSRDGLPARLAALGARVEQWDLSDLDRGRALLAEVDAAIFTPILTVAEQAAALAPGKRLLFFSSNNVAIDDKALIYARLREAEKRVRDVAPGGIILRPTMIYGYPGDGNLSVLMGAMRRLPVTPIIGAGRAMQQPVFYQDVADIAASLIAKGSAHGIVTVAGPAPMSQAELYTEVRAAAGAKTVIAPIPAPIAGAAIRLASLVRLPTPLSLAQIARADQDKTPAGETVLLGDTGLAGGLRDLAAALDGAAGGA